MNIKEFAALKLGDRIANPMASTAGAVTDTDGGGVTVRWDGSELTRYYGAVTTAWTHWTKEATEGGSACRPAPVTIITE